MLNNMPSILLSCGAGLLIGIAIMVIISKVGLNRDQQKADLIIKEANLKAENLIKQGTLEGKSVTHEMKLAAEKEIKERKAEVIESENKLLRREDALNYRDKALTDKENQHEAKARSMCDSHRHQGIVDAGLQYRKSFTLWRRASCSTPTGQRSLTGRAS